MSFPFKFEIVFRIFFTKKNTMRRAKPVQGLWVMRTIIIIFFVYLLLVMRKSEDGSSGLKSEGRNLKQPLEERSQHLLKGEEVVEFENGNDITEALESVDSVKFSLEKYSKLLPNHPKLLEYIFQKHLFPPLPVAYELDGVIPLDKGLHVALQKLLGNKKYGIFMEFGANDGEFNSGTLQLERHFGWTGLLMEPTTRKFEKLRQKGRRAWLSDACLSTKNVVELSSSQNLEIGQSSNDIHRVKAKTDIDHAHNAVTECFPLYSMVLALNMTTIDYFSLNTGGTELEVLKTIPFNKINIGAMTIKGNYIRMNPKAEEDLQVLLNAHNFILVQDLDGYQPRDYLFAHESLLANDYLIVDPLPDDWKRDNDNY